MGRSTAYAAIPSGQTSHPMSRRTDLDPTAKTKAATELSYAPRGAPEPDLQHKRTIKDTRHTPMHPTLSGAHTASRSRNLSHKEVSQQAGLCPHPQKDGRPFETWARKHGDYRIRTDDPLLAKQVLYQLS